MNHSPLPWTYEPESDNELSYPFDDVDNCAGSIISEDTDGSYIARIWADGNMPADDAKFICLAVNHYEELVSVVKDLIEYDSVAIWNRAKALIAKLEAEK